MELTPNIPGPPGSQQLAKQTLSPAERSAICNQLLVHNQKAKDGRTQRVGLEVKPPERISLEVQYLRLQASTAGAWVQSPVGELR